MSTWLIQRKWVQITIADTLRKKMIDQQICFILWHRISEYTLCLKHVTVLISLQMGKSENHISQKLISDNRITIAGRSRRGFQLEHRNHGIVSKISKNERNVLWTWHLRISPRGQNDSTSVVVLGPSLTKVEKRSQGKLMTSESCCVCLEQEGCHLHYRQSLTQEEVPVDARMALTMISGK